MFAFATTIGLATTSPEVGVGGTPVPRDADAWPRDGQRDSRLLEFGETDAVRIDFMKRRLNTFIGVLNLAGMLSPAK